MDKYPCRQLGAPFLAIGSEPTTFPNLHSSEPALRGRLHGAAPRGPVTMRPRCASLLEPLSAWLSSVVGSWAHHPLMGFAPVRVWGLRASEHCLELATGDRVVRAEFVVHRYGDSHGEHYQVECSSSAPYRLYSYRRTGVVPSGTLGSLEGHNADGERY